MLLAKTRCHSLGVRGAPGERKEARTEGAPSHDLLRCTHPHHLGGMLSGPEVEPSGAQRMHLHGVGDVPPLVVTLEPPDLRQIP